MFGVLSSNRFARICLEDAMRYIKVRKVRSRVRCTVVLWYCGTVDGGTQYPRILVSSHDISNRVCPPLQYACLKTFGKRLADHQVIAFKIAEMVRKIEGIHSHLEQLTYQMKMGATENDVMGPIALLKVAATKVCLSVSCVLFQSLCACAVAFTVLLTCRNWSWLLGRRRSA
jgi:alkylation response protein AidB-like acyl-CoA dehydrogenase